MQLCPRCRQKTVIFSTGDNHVCTACYLNFSTGMTPEDFARDIAQKVKQKEHENELRELRIVQRRKRAKDNPEFRSAEYLEFMRKGGLYPYLNKLHDNHIYIIELKKSVSRDKKKFQAFPSPEFDDIFPVGSTGFKGCVYVGITGDTKKKLGRKSIDVCEDRFNQHKDELRAGRKIVTKYSKTDDFETCGKSLTEQYGMANVVNNYPKDGIRNERYESWIGFMLYRLGYHVWGPHAHKGKHREEFGDFLGKDDFI